jgi:V/A-type H+-transporting ATPase subunit E
MAEEIKNLIEKIQEEGIKAGEDKAREIEAEAKRKAVSLMEKAKAEAQEIITEGREKVSRMEESAKASIQQAGRDLLLSLKEELHAMLERLVQSSVAETLSPSEMAKILHELIKKLAGASKEDIWVWLKKEDGEKLKMEFLSRLKEETKRNIVLKPSEEILGGFIISFDAGKSHFDFTDQALAEYLGTFLKPQLNQILNSIAKEK